ncbi:MAG: STN domain-containing protein [Bacteroidales bacterium]|nr:STN domain-containing protein [Bacteroidales bacterium]
MECPDFNISLERQKDKGALRFWPLVLLLFFIVFVLPQKANAQNFNPLISFSVESCTLDVALEKLFGEYELNVAFSKAELSKIRIESYSCSYKSVDEVLADLLKGTDYGFRRIGKQYVIRKNKQLANEPDATITKPAEPNVEVVKPKTEIVENKTGDTIYIVDSVQIIKTVMRYDTVVEVKHEVRTDTVYEVKYQGWQIPWPKFRDNGWFVAPSITLNAVSLKHDEAMPEPENGTVEVLPSSAYGLGLDAGYKRERFSAEMGLAYRSMRYRFLLEQTVFGGDYYVNDTLDIYYTVHPSGDTTYQYILDSTYVPLTTTNFAYRDINRLDYLSVGLFAAFDFVRLDHFRAFVKAGVSVDFLVNYAGSLNANESPFHQPIAKEQVEPIRLSMYGGLGCAFKIVNRVELVPEVHYRATKGSLYRADFPFDIKMRLWDFRLGLTYYF